ncbi:PDZ domain-containing protein, partial [Microbacterium sp.]|uniref:PDZ domain-containing protein n=1 Tax=Microbacterium sp. TaxID=51671 RepID=UPI003C762C8B
MYADRERSAGRSAVALLDEDTVIVPARRAPMSRQMLIGIWSLALALLALLALTLIPTSFVIQRPGPVFNTLGTTTNSAGDDVPLISVSGAETFPTSGSLDLLTVQVVGNRDRTPSWFELAMAWFDPSMAVIPIDEVFPQGQSTEQRNEESAVMMVDSQKEATAAALVELGYDVNPMVRVYGLTDDSAAQGILEPNDVIRAADGQAITETDELRKAINDAGGAAVELTIDRGGQVLTESVTPKASTVDGKTTW